jgi:Uma2 family endonuclease
MVHRMDTQHAMISSMATPRARGLATAADIEHDERLEVVNGHVVSKDEGEPYGEAVQQASPTIVHGKVHHAIGLAIGGYSDGASVTGPGGWLFANEVTIEFGPHEVYRPDIAGWRIEHVPEPLLETPVRITPDWVCEILSPSTTNRDVGRKLRTYHRSRVSHYWVAHPHPTTQLLQVYRWHEQGYLLVLTAGAGEIVRAEPFDAIDLDISAIFGWPGRAGREHK